jgi:hypothetical protein
MPAAGSLGWLWLRCHILLAPLRGGCAKHSADLSLAPLRGPGGICLAAAWLTSLHCCFLYLLAVQSTVLTFPLAVSPPPGAGLPGRAQADEFALLPPLRGGDMGWEYVGRKGASRSSFAPGSNSALTGDYRWVVSLLCFCVHQCGAFLHV